MSREDVEIVRRLLEEFIAIGPDAVPEDFVHDMSTFRGWPDKPVFRGVDGMSEFLDAWRAPYDDWSIAVDRLQDVGGGRVVAVLAQRGRLRGSDADVGLRFGIVYTVENGQARHSKVYLTVEEAFEAVGLRE